MPYPKQLDFPGFNESPRRKWKDRLFFAILLGTQPAEKVHHLTGGLRRDYGLIGRPLLKERLHISLHFLGQYTAFPHGIVRIAREAAATIAVPAFDVAFDRVVSVGVRPFNRPLVLLSSGRNDELEAFNCTLGAALVQRGLAYAENAYWSPHVTLLYDDRRIVDRAVENIRWTVESFELVYSLVGRTQYDRIERWSLRA